MASNGYNSEDRDRGGSRASERGARSGISASSRLFAPTQSSLAKKKPTDGHRSDGDRGRRMSDVSDLASSHSREPQKESRGRQRRSSFPVEESHGRGEAMSGEDASTRSVSSAAGVGRAGTGRGVGGGVAAAGQRTKLQDGRSAPAAGRKERSYSDMSSPEKPSRTSRAAGFMSSPEKPQPQSQQHGQGSGAPQVDHSRVADVDRLKKPAPVKAPSPRGVPPPIKTAVQGEAVRARMARPEGAGDMSPRAIDMSPRAFRGRGEMPFRGGEMSPRASDMSPRAFHARVDAPTYSSSRKEKAAPSRNALLGSSRVGGSSTEGLHASSLDSAEMAAMLAASKQAAGQRAAGVLAGAEHESWAAADAVAMGQDAGLDWRLETHEQPAQDGGMHLASRGSKSAANASNGTRQLQGGRDASLATLKDQPQPQHEQHRYASAAPEESSASTAGALGDLDDVSKPSGASQRGPGPSQTGAKMEEGSPVSVLEANESDPSHLSEPDGALLKEAAGHGPSAWHQQLMQGHQSVVAIQSHEEGSGAAAAAVVAAIGSPLPSYLQDISDLDFMGDISGMEQDLEYVRHVLLLSGFAGKRLPPVHSAENPIHPDVFEQLEQGITTGSVEGAQDAIIIDRARQAEERRQRRLLFDAVNEALGRRLTPYYARPVWVKPSELVIKKLPVGQYLLQEVWEEIHDWPIASSDEVYDILDDAARRDMSRGTERWAEMGLERAEAAFELELMLLEDMLNDIAADICTADAAKKERRLRQRRLARPRTLSPMGSRA